MTGDVDDSSRQTADVPDDPDLLEQAQFAYEVQTRQLERSANAAQGLMTAVTLLGALGGPLIVPTGGHDFWDVAIGALLICYLAALGLSLRHSLAVLATSQRKLGPTRAGGGFLFYGDIAAYSSAAGFRTAFGEELLRDPLGNLLDQVYVMATLAAAKSGHVVRAIRWLITGMMIFAVALVLTFVHGTLMHD